MVAILGEDEATEQDKPDPNVYQPEEDEDDELEIDRRIRRVHERLRRLTIVGVPDLDDDEICDTDVEGGWDVGYGVNKRCEGVDHPSVACAISISAIITGITLDATCWSDVSLSTVSETYNLFCGCSPDCAGLGCTWDIFGSLGLIHHSCPPVTDYNIDVLIGHISGTWYVFAYTLGSPFSPGVGVVFYGHAASISSPITNEGAYGITFLDTPLLDQTFGDCTPSSGAGNFHIIGSGGDITITA